MNRPSDDQLRGVFVDLNDPAHQVTKLDTRVPDRLQSLLRLLRQAPLHETT
jgi:hypothetical protein